MTTPLPHLWVVAYVRRRRDIQVDLLVFRWEPTGEQGAFFPAFFKGNAAPRAEATPTDEREASPC
ncbi:MAG: hypothetical protein C4321_11005 [Chloroflexota bacterium]